MTSRPPIVAQSIEDAVRIALPYLRISHAGLSDRLAPDDDCVAGVFTAITTLERALSREEITTEIKTP